MGVRVREKPKGSGVWWVFVNHQHRRKARKVGDRRLPGSGRHNRRPSRARGRRVSCR